MTFKKIIRKITDTLRSMLFRKSTGYDLYLYCPESVETQYQDKLCVIIERLKFFNNNINIIKIKSFKLRHYFDFSLIGIVDENSINKTAFRLKIDDIFNFDYENNHIDGWAYHWMLTKMDSSTVESGINLGKEKLSDINAQLSTQFHKSYILGTGPSLEKAIEINWEDGIRIVSNTIVKDVDLWKHINPHFIVAGDAIYHYGISSFAKNFRADLKQCLSLTNTYFVFPAYFYPFCLKEFAEFEGRLIPIPKGKSDLIHISLIKKYCLPTLDNVLPLLLLPLACTLSKVIGLWGFDGRSPNDKLFWKNSSKHFYTDDVEQMMSLHPAFYKKLVPTGNADSYVKTVHGDVLEQALTKAELDGFQFHMLHPSYTENLNKRYNGEQTHI